VNLVPELGVHLLLMHDVCHSRYHRPLDALGIFRLYILLKDCWLEDICTCKGSKFYLQISLDIFN
jgi:hypothetical protein